MSGICFYLLFFIVVYFFSHCCLVLILDVYQAKLRAIFIFIIYCQNIFSSALLGSSDVVLIMTVVFFFRFRFPEFAVIGPESVRFCILSLPFYVLIRALF